MLMYIAVSSWTTHFNECVVQVQRMLILQLRNMLWGALLLELIVLLVLQRVPRAGGRRGWGWRSAGRGVAELSGAARGGVG